MLSNTVVHRRSFLEDIAAVEEASVVDDCNGVCRCSAKRTNWYHHKMVSTNNVFSKRSSDSTTAPTVEEDEAGTPFCLRMAKQAF